MFVERRKPVKLYFLEFHFETPAPTHGASSYQNKEHGHPAPAQRVLQGLAGLPPDCGPAAHAPQFDSEALAGTSPHPGSPGDRILIVRGPLCRRATRKAGFPVATGWPARSETAGGMWISWWLTAWRPQLSADDLALARQASHNGSLWLLSSSKPSPIWLRRCRSTTGTPPARTGHPPRIAQAAHDAGLARCGNAVQPLRTWWPR